ncbi:DUF2808 domain-containing protein [Alkalinema sp. FACHB-956]|uniref:DUF2808 domain-containing protein n=1 Tax=Alkalinema sp. FACHB-956 TaxID=2692768 RepID=UPI001683D651|nr:DUF2808 domain-containing protein [Alkalinema sp. FACHB-956]MBD2325468.1 DUF2808 domain-containing protein [Alkalinema sp. FACHB-956]
MSPHYFTRLTTIALLGGLLGLVGVGSSTRPISAVQLQDGMVYFKQPPSLVDAITTSTIANDWTATYYFTISLPATAGEPLQKVTITQAEGIDRVHFSTQHISAFAGQPRQLGQRFTIANADVDRAARTVTIEFDPALAPGQMVTIVLDPDRNPFSEGVYLFGVTAYPQGEKAHGQFLGYGRFHFYRGVGLFFR